MIKKDDWSFVGKPYTGGVIAAPGTVVAQCVTTASLFVQDHPPASKLIRTALRRGVRKRCPHCGEGRLFSGWSLFPSCSVCGLVFARNPGDTWAFTIIGDRVPLAGMIVVIYFGVIRSHPVTGVTMLIGFAALGLWTTPNRWGLSIALHYLSRVYSPDPQIPFHPSRRKSSASAVARRQTP